MEKLVDSTIPFQSLVWPQYPSLTSSAFLSDRYCHLIDFVGYFLDILLLVFSKLYNGVNHRQGEVECPYYMRNGSCKFGAECKFNHPDPSTIGGTNSPSFHGNNGVSIGSFSPKSTFQASSTSWSSPRHANGTTPFIPVMLSQTHGVPSQTPEWNGYQVVYTSALDLNNIYFCSNYL